MLAVLILILLTHLAILFTLAVAVGGLHTIAIAITHIAQTFSAPDTLEHASGEWPSGAPESSADEERR